MRPIFTSAPQHELGRRLARLARVFPVDPIAQQPMGADDVVSYYEQCFDAYRRHHSHEGAVHMAINEAGRFDAAGFTGQLERLQATWSGAPQQDMLELAFGHGFNLAWLAPRYAHSRFAGIDITPRHVEHVRALLDERAIRNVELRQGDFHRLPYADASFDHAYCVEAFCYATDTPRALAEIARVLRPGGTLTLFDGYLTRSLERFSPDEAMAVGLVAKGMAIDRFQVIGELVDAARSAGFEALQVRSLDEQVMPSLRRLERLTGAVIHWPWLGRRALARRHPMRGRNVLAGCLMRMTVSHGLMTYQHVVLRKPA